MTLGVLIGHPPMDEEGVSTSASRPVIDKEHEQLSLHILEG